MLDDSALAYLDFFAREVRLNHRFYPRHLGCLSRECHTVQREHDFDFLKGSELTGTQEAGASVVRRAYSHL